MAFQLLRRPQTRLHIGSGRERLEGWVNIDAQALPGVDVVADVTKSLNYSNVEAVFAEHFIEHLALADAVAFLHEAWRVLGKDGWVRLSTPNPDWVWATHYKLSYGGGDSAGDAEGDAKREAALRLNRAFHGWRHQFLWNREMLGEALAASGFTSVRWCRYGDSELPFFRGIERHATYGDNDELPHVIIVEACKGPAQPERSARFHSLIQHELLQHLSD